MTNRTGQDAMANHASEGLPPAGRAGESSPSIRSAAVTAGAAILLMSVLAGFGNFVALEGLVTDGEAARTVADISESEGLFRLGVLSMALVIVLDVVVAWALYRVFSPVSKGLSMLAAAFRLVYAGVFMVAIGELLGVVRLVGDDTYLSVFGADQLGAQVLMRIDAYTDVWTLGLLLFGLHLLVIGYLAYRSGYVPRSLGALVAIAGLGYVIDTFGAVLSTGTWTDVSSFTFVGEFLLALWLVIWGRRLTLSEPAVTPSR
jgi:hypothetical protein